MYMDLRWRVPDLFHEPIRVFFQRYSKARGELLAI